MEELTKLLNDVQGSYYDFVVAMLHYAKKRKSRLVVLTDFIKKIKDLTTSDIIEFVSSQLDFYEDAAYTKQVNEQGLIQSEDQFREEMEKLCVI